jgi:hypothetical protein
MKILQMKILQVIIFFYLIFNDQKANLGLNFISFFTKFQSVRKKIGSKQQYFKI